MLTFCGATVLHVDQQGRSVLGRHTQGQRQLHLPGSPVGLNGAVLAACCESGGRTSDHFSSCVLRPLCRGTSPAMRSCSAGVAVESQVAAALPRESALGLVSRVTPVQTALRNCTGDEGRPFGFGDQVADPKPPRAATVKSRGGERRGKVGTMIPAGMVERGERKRTAAEASKAE
jgi:hypothetical protein